MEKTRGNILKGIALLALTVLSLTLIGCNQGKLSKEQVAEEFLRLYLEVPDYTRFRDSNSWDEAYYIALQEEKKEAFADFITDGMSYRMLMNGEFVLAIRKARASRMNMVLNQVEFSLDRTEDDGNTVYLDYLAELELTYPEADESKIVQIESVFPTKLVKQGNRWLVDWHHINVPNG